ncbi:Hypothetical protein SRAE_X000183600 [Strongyloides ratti]|uniref:Uncharacterized protein n=1 Tax=Strongyloides ratti TaxID=34506 RepID=A0A090KW41_STRRB|nr:Hypothetical protein SRAE_X000183600 [Strongyloides ratti]CEF60096.1 Hypothetical protein SRAE_X000183600 [Strongyloides ratti]
MIIEFEKLFNNSRHDLLKNFYKTNHYNLFDIRNDQLYSNIENLELFEKYYFVYKILSQKKFDKDKKDTFFEKLNNSQQNIEIINKNKLIFKKLSTTTYVPVYKILNNLKIEKLNQTTIKDKSIFKKIYLPERYNSNEIKKSLIPKKENESNYLEKNFKNLQDNDSSISGNLEPMSKDYHIVNISKINQNPLHKNNTIYKVIQNILNILLQTNDKSNGNSVDGIVKNVNS